MTRYEELVKALRCCGNEGCHECPYKKHMYAKFCWVIAMKDAAAAIEELQAEVDTLKRTDSKRCQECLYLGQPVGEHLLPHWVSVEEPPKEHGPFLCASKSTMLDGSTHWFFELCWYSDGDLKDVVWDAEKDSGFYSWSASQDRDIDSKVDYWMPIEPPQEVQE